MEQHLFAFGKCVLSVKNMKLLIINGSSLLNLLYWEYSPDSQWQEEKDTDVIVAFLAHLQQWHKEVQADGICVTFDDTEANFRQKYLPSYRTPSQRLSPQRLAQIAPLKEILTAIDIPCYSQASWESKDVMGTVAKQAEQIGWEVVLVTGEYDAFQLITKQISVWKIIPWNKKQPILKMNLEEFQKKYEFPPTHIPDYKACMGESSERVEGIQGVQQQIILPLIQKYHSIKSIYETLHRSSDSLEVDESVLEKLTLGEEKAKHTYELAVIHCDLPLKLSLEIIPVPQLSKLPAVLQEMKHFAIMEQLAFAPLQGEVLRQIPWTEIRTKKEAEEFLSRCETGKFLAVHKEKDLCGIAIATENQCGIFLSSTMEDYRSFHREFFKSSRNLVVHNSKILHKQLLHEEIQTNCQIEDLSIAGYLLAPDLKEYPLHSLLKTYKNIAIEPMARHTLENLDTNPSQRQQALADFACHAQAIHSLYQPMMERLKEHSLEEVYHNIDLPLAKVLAEMEQEGILVDKIALENYGEALLLQKSQLEEEIYDLAGESFNLQSPQQLGRILFETLGLPAEKKTKNGYSTSATVLKKLEKQYPSFEILQSILKYKLLSKLYTTYVQGLLKHIQENQRIHSTFQNISTATGRLSSTEPNLQNIPIRTEQGAKFREMFVAQEGNVILTADYSQMELRIIAHLSQDKNMIHSFLQEEDIHLQTARHIFQVDRSKINQDMRHAAKAINFGILYGMSHKTLAEEIGTSVEEAKSFRSRYFECYPQIQVYLEQIKREGREKGYVSTLFGRVRWLPELKSRNFTKRSQAERMAQNTPSQGSSADIIKLAMIAVSTKLKEQTPKAKLLLQIHDELLVECPQEQQEEIAQMVKKEMEQVCKLTVPLTVQWKISKSWGATK